MPLLFPKAIDVDISKEVQGKLLDPANKDLITG